VAHTDTALMLVETITIDAPIAAVYAALTEPEQLVEWWGSDGGYQSENMTADMRIGGEWKLSGIGKEGPFTVGGIYRVINPPQHLEFTWRHSWGDGDDASNDTIVRYDLEEHAGTTTLTLTHTNFGDQEDRDEHAEGWPVVLAWMAAYVTKK
jgi:uncharacterized protein YndB with AHSA1/START domain